DLPQAPPHEELQRIHDTAMQHIRTSRLTDVELIYPPSQIALACLSLAHPEIAAFWARSKNADVALEGIESIKRTITRDGDIPSVDVVREIDRRLKICKNPEKVVGVQEDKEAELKRMKKAENVRKAAEQGNPFGEGLVAQANLDDDD
ncbi:hypothetical protein BGY98DRAFT_932553, partial [Russula aff. rugulosa BPL654]